VNVTKKTRGNSNQPTASSPALVAGRHASADDLFAWASNRVSDRPAAPRMSSQSKVVDINDARTERDRAAGQYAQKRTYYSRGLGAIVPKIAREAVGKRATLDANLQVYWVDIVGEEFASSTHPRRSRFDHPNKRINGVLEITVERGYGAFLSHAKGQILDKLNAYHGLGTFRDLKFKEGPLPKSQPKRQLGLRSPQRPQHIDLSDPSTRRRLGLRAEGQTAASRYKQQAGWVPPTPHRHRLALKMADNGGTGVSHKPLADALTYLGASLVKREH